MCCFIAFKYQDSDCDIRIFEYLNNNFNFSQNSTHRLRTITTIRSTK